MKLSQYVAFEEVEGKKKTKVWEVNGQTGWMLGTVKWYPSWRRYAFFPREASSLVFDPDCLFTIAKFCEDKTNEHYNGAGDTCADAVGG